MTSYPKTDIPKQALSAAEYDPAAVREWLTWYYAGTKGGIQICGFPDHKGGREFTEVEAAAAFVDQLNRMGQHSIYHRVLTVRSHLPHEQRGGEDQSAEAVALWADLDFGTEGHKATASGLPLPPDEDSARKVVAQAGLPDPTVWVHSGGGLYPYWRLDGRLVIADQPEVFAEFAALSESWQQILHRAAESLGWHYGSEVGDLARMLRVPGTLNRKTAIPRLCHVLGELS
ncbi:hypothetical protein [Streptomyces sp. NBC_01264]|uniref:hypothetical protein n=1 Tax=Streptomyces sp. NBC_01264 TaxID=2903804 RepID=UPI0022508793|nr:hypothetical protein [Streptomyces sp. NBC_01264]MCX4783357.1 hypothetical protein [Streptomyces sp. NBC_01264]